LDLGILGIVARVVCCWWAWEARGAGAGGGEREGVDGHIIVIDVGRV
jgi:hypothetical protein